MVTSMSCQAPPSPKSLKGGKSTNASLRIQDFLPFSIFKMVSFKEGCRTMKMKGMVFRYMWVYSKEDTMAHTRRPIVTS